MDFFIKEDNVRPGNRGGKNLFNWNDVRLLNNKDRESYLGVTQSLGFLDKGGKWRKRDWWQNYDPTMPGAKNLIEANKIKSEREQIKKDEQKMLREAILGQNPEKSYTRYDTKPVIPITNSIPKASAANNVNNNNKKLTDFQWKELMKKEANYNPDDTQLYEFYENDQHRAGLGMKASISFRTNPYEKDMENELTRLEGVNTTTEPKEGDPIENNPYVEKGVNINQCQNEKEKEKEKEKNPLLKKYIKAYMQKQDQTVKQEIEKSISKSKEKKKKRYSRSRSHERTHHHKYKHHK